MSTRDVCKMMKNVANIIFEQDWVLLENKKDSCENDVGGEDSTSCSHDETDDQDLTSADLTYFTQP